MRPEGQKQIHYMHFTAMMALSFLVMFAFMYAMVDRLANVYPNLNQAYMAGLMVAPMAILEIVLMRSMYPDRALNRIIVASGILLLLLCWFGIREQVAVNDRSFLRSMIPHHAGAILMCQQASITAPQVRNLCGKIIASQQREIEEMKTILNQLN